MHTKRDSLYRSTLMSEAPSSKVKFQIEIFALANSLWFKGWKAAGCGSLSFTFPFHYYFLFSFFQLFSFLISFFFWSFLSFHIFVICVPFYFSPLSFLSFIIFLPLFSFLSFILSFFFSLSHLMFQFPYFSLLLFNIL